MFNLILTSQGVRPTMRGPLGGAERPTLWGGTTHNFWGGSTRYVGRSTLGGSTMGRIDRHPKCQLYNLQKSYTYHSIYSLFGIKKSNITAAQCEPMRDETFTHIHLTIFHNFRHFYALLFCVFIGRFLVGYSLFANSSLFHYLP